MAGEKRGIGEVISARRKSAEISDNVGPDRRRLRISEDRGTATQRAET